jgi:riboflavin kinase/FMN adenylyltransferase
MTTIKGIVQEGKKRGKQLGFPTANITVAKSIPEGIYISLTLYKGKEYRSLTFIGIARTFNETIYQSETYLFDFEENIYNKHLTIHLIKKIRDNKQFTNERDLILQMELDKKEAQRYFTANA